MTNHNSEQIHVADAERGKTYANESRGFGFTSDWMKQNGASFLSQSLTVVMQNQNNSADYTFNAHVKAAVSSAY